MSLGLTLEEVGEHAGAVMELLDARGLKTKQIVAVCLGVVAATHACQHPDARAEIESFLREVLVRMYSLKPREELLARVAEEAKESKQ